MSNLTVAQALQLGIQHHQDGRLAEAEQHYRQILAAEPRQADALHLLGLIAHQVGRNDVAVEMICKAIALVPANAIFHSNLGEAYRKLDRLEEAIGAFQRSIGLDPRLPEAHSNLGNVLRDAGRFDEAIEACRRAIELSPDFAEAYNNLGNTLGDVGRFEDAIAACRRAIELKPGFPEAHNNLGNAFRGQGRLEQAVAAFLRAIELKPDFAQAHNNLGNTLKDEGRDDAAVAAYRRAIELKPDYAEAHNNLGNALREQGKFEAAVVACRRALALKPDFAQAHNNLGNALKTLGHRDEAIAAFRRAIQLKPDFQEAYSNIGNALWEQGHLDEAVAVYRRALQLKPDSVEMNNSLGSVLRDQGRLDEAIAVYRRALELKPDSAETLNNLGSMHWDQGRLDEAVAAYCRAIQLQPDFAMGFYNLGNVLTVQGALDEALAAGRQAIQLKPDDAGMHSNLLLGLHYLPDFVPGEVFLEHSTWAEVHAQPVARLSADHVNDPDPGRRLRVGYISPDFREHPVAYFVEGLLGEHDRAQVESYCYADLMREDGFSERLRQHAGQWRRITGMADSQVADLIAKDGIDILVDLAGHTARNRLLVFARKPAPVQVTWLGYCDTTGLRAMDYRLTDGYADPPGTTEHLHTEQLVRLPDIFACFRPAVDSPDVLALPALARGHVTFASFHTLAKINGPLLERWVRILIEVPGSRLLMAASGLDEESQQRRLRDVFAGRGVDGQRLEFNGRQSMRDYLALHNAVDVLLDCDPFTGHTISCHALWMGVPVVTLAGKTHCARMVGSVLSTLGLPELIGASADQYVEIAVKLAGDLPRLEQLRTTLRERMRNSPLTDAPRFARNVEAAYRQMWRAWCAKQCSNPAS